MRTLFAISIFALLALLWASISMARHIRQARQRRKQNEHERLTGEAPGNDEVQEQQNPPATEPSEDKVERADWQYFNKDMGDLSDPYEAPRNRPKSPAEQ
jgi:hypothetical protein